jgi:hypothetical protein
MEWEIAANKAIYTCIHCAWKLENGGFLTYGFKISDNGTRPIAGHFVTAALLKSNASPVSFVSGPRDRVAFTLIVENILHSVELDDVLLNSL